MKTLVIVAHPNKNSFSQAIVERYAHSAISSGKEVEVIDLYTSEFRQDFFEFADIKNPPSDPER